MKKKIFTLLFTSLSLISLVACSSQDKKTTQSSSSTKSSVKITKKSSSSTKESSKETGDDSDFQMMIDIAQSQVPKLLEQYKDTYSDITIEAGEDHTIIYTYTYLEHQDVEIDAEAMKPTVVKAMKSTITSLQSQYPDIKVKLAYLNPDKSEVASFIITKEDVENVEA